MPRFDPQGIFNTLAKHDVRYVLIGGVAATLHGSPLRTGDVDICPARDPDNLERLASTLRALDARVRAPGVVEGVPFSVDAELLASVELLNLTTRYGDFDLAFVPSGSRGYDELAAHAVDIELDDVSVPTVALPDLIRLKEATGRDKDRDAVAVLRALEHETRGQSKT